jgi:hypothetical protein
MPPHSKAVSRWLQLLFLKMSKPNVNKSYIGTPGTLIACFFAISCLFCTCNFKRNVSFYCDEAAAYDVWRLPIVEPFELISSDTLKGWTLSWLATYNFDSIGHHSIDSLNFRNGIILCSIDNGWHQKAVIDIYGKREVIFKTQDEYIKFTESRKLPKELFHITTVFSEWRSTKKLPWASAIDHNSQCILKN